MPSWENLDVFLQHDVAGGFALTATVVFESQKSADASATPESKPITGIFDEPYLNADLGEYEVDSAQPRFLCKSVDVQGVRRGDELYVNERAYFIMTYPQHDGTGLALLKLEPKDD
ncbi:MAG: head-tail joining protein [Pseudomonadota bacterium]|nr:head-tail joining protein [Pseudomonadota bacterium]